VSYASEELSIVCKPTTYSSMKAHASSSWPQCTLDVAVMGGQDAVGAVSDQRVAMETLAAIGRRDWPREPVPVQFARALEANPELAARAHRTPVAPVSGVYPFPT
jgi:hypothetical protein